MHVKAQLPIFVPHDFVSEMEKLSKAALMDMVWDLATRCAGSEDDAAIIGVVRSTAEIIVAHRKDAKDDSRRTPMQRNR